MVRWIKIRPLERGLLFRDRVFERVLGPGRHLVFDPLLRVRVERVSVREVWLESAELDVIVRSGRLPVEARVLDLGDHERALVWVDGRFERVVGPGLRVLWTSFHDVRLEIVSAKARRFEHPELARIAASSSAPLLLDLVHVDEGWAAVLLVDGRVETLLEPGRHAYWRGEGRLEARQVDRREQTLDIAGQELMTADKVTLRLNAALVFRVTDPVKAATAVESYAQAVYREAQLALRAVTGTRDLDAFLSDREQVARDMEAQVRPRAAALGLEIVSAGIRDVILPGEMKTILNRVTEARKAAEANLVTRREETAAMRSQANTARIFESTPGLMRLRELEVLEKVAEKAKLNVIVGEKGLANGIVKLL